MELIILHGFRYLTIPPTAPLSIGNLMRWCWTKDPDGRPSFEEINSYLNGIMSGEGGAQDIAETSGAVRIAHNSHWSGPLFDKYIEC